jgi:2-polyprenyl-3-methyl-5-hydroxy-6-metoxy-1,4-benzoquinol methylase
MLLGARLRFAEPRMKLPPPKPDQGWSHLRQHDLEELWDHSLSPHVASSFAARLGLMLDVISRLAGEGGRILDVGCAQGTLGLTLAERGFQVSLLDVRATNIEYARARHERGQVDFHVGLLDERTPPRADYDVVVCTEVLEHVTEPSRLLSQLASKARPGGHLCLTTPNADYAFSYLPSFGKVSQDVIDAAEVNSLDGDAHRFLYTREELIALARGVGLHLEDHGFFLPAWLEGNAKTRYVHRVLYRLRGDIVHLPPTIPGLGGLLSRRLCSSQWAVFRRT